MFHGAVVRTPGGSFFACRSRAGAATGPMAFRAGGRVSIRPPPNRFSVHHSGATFLLMASRGTPLGHDTKKSVPFPTALLRLPGLSNNGYPSVCLLLKRAASLALAASNLARSASASVKSAERGTGVLVTTGTCGAVGLFTSSAVVGGACFGLFGIRQSRRCLREFQRRMTGRH